jgi:CRISPR-associated protein Cas6/Cse3/CasE subtype I-E
MIFMTSIELGNEMETANATADREWLHKAVWRLFDFDKSSDRDFVFSVDNGALNVFSKRKPLEINGLHVASEEIDTSIFDDKRCAFQTTFCPQKRDPGSARRKSITDSDEIRDNLRIQLQRYGCSCETIDLRSRPIIHNFKKGNANVSFSSVKCAGVVKVKNAESLLLSGVGREKAYGFGLVYLIPIA